MGGMKHTFFAAAALALAASTVHAAEPAPDVDAPLSAQRTTHVVEGGLIGGGVGLFAGVIGGGVVALGLGAWNGAFQRDPNNYLQVATPAATGAAIFTVGAVIGGLVGTPVGALAGASVMQE